jgi:hypothetical protein
VAEEWSRDVMQERSSTFVNDTMDYMQFPARCVPSHDLVYMQGLPMQLHAAYTHMETLMTMKSLGGERMRAAVAQGVIKSWWAAAAVPQLLAPSSTALRIGILSSDLKLSHPIGQLLLPIMDALYHAGGMFASCLVIRRVGLKDISSEFQDNYGRVCRGGLDVFESSDTIETAQRINAMQLTILVWINGWTSEATAALLIPRPAPVQIAWLGNPSFAVTKLVDFLVSGEHSLYSTQHSLPARALFFLRMRIPCLRHRVLPPRPVRAHA